MPGSVPTDAREPEAPPAVRPGDDAPPPASAGGWRGRTRWLPVLVVAGAAALVGALLLLSPDRGGEPSGTTSTTDDGFTVEAGGGTLEFGQDGDQASLDFSGPDATGSFSFDVDGDGVVAEGEGGTFELTGGQPPGWPGAFPVPPGATVVRGSIVDGGALRQLSTTYRSPDDLEEVRAFYVDALADADAIVEPPSAAAPDTVTISFDGTWSGFVALAPVADGTTAAVQLYVEPTP